MVKAFNEAVQAIIESMIENQNAVVVGGRAAARHQSVATLAHGAIRPFRFPTLLVFLPSSYYPPLWFWWYDNQSLDVQQIWITVTMEAIIWLRCPDARCTCSGKRWRPVI